ncbi:MAG: hypothetical protein L3J41_05930 [Melioribacteraceae bacterium]|nr:hypothetical protein [Melioribacteraceae bacterium]
MTIIFNKKSEKTKRRKLRNNPTYTEKVLWQSLRRKQIHGEGSYCLGKKPLTPALSQRERELKTIFFKVGGGGIILELFIIKV